MAAGPWLGSERGSKSDSSSLTAQRLLSTQRKKLPTRKVVKLRTGIPTGVL
jgi:hypothetical protein